MVVGFSAASVRQQANARSPDERVDANAHDTAGAGGKNEKEGEGDSKLSCTAAALLLRAQPLRDGPNQRGVIRVTGDKWLNGEVDIAPGTVFIIDADSSLEFGRSGTRTTLIARGTADNPIRFCSDQAVLGRWRGLRLSNGLTSDSVLQNAHIYDAGADGPALTVDAPVSVIDVTVHGSKTVGVMASTFGEKSSGLTVSDTERAALVLTGQSAVDKLPKGSKFIDNADNSAHIRFHGFTGGSVHFANHGIPYLQEKAMHATKIMMEFDPGAVTGDLRIGQGNDVTLEPGVEVIFKTGNPYELDIGWNGDQATFVARGTAAQPIIFRGETDDIGTWKGITIESNVSTNSVFDHIEVRNAGLVTDAQVTIQNSTFSKSPGFGIVKGESNTTDYTATNSFMGNVRGDVGVR